MNSLIESLDGLFGKKAPQLPVAFKEFLVKAAPWLVIISLIFIVLGLLALLPLMLGTGAMYGAMGAYGAYGSMGIGMVLVSLVFSLAIGVLQLMALSGLFKRTHRSWDLLFYAQVVSLVGSLIHFNIIGFIISALIGFYILFQIRPYYTGAATMSTPAAPIMPPKV